MGTIVVMIILISVTALAVRTIINDRKRGKGCSGCPGGYRGTCCGACTSDSSKKKNGKR